MRLRQWAMGVGQWAMLVAVLLAGCEGGQPSSSEAAMQKWVGQNFSELTVQDLDGAPQALKDAVLFEKKPVILNVWATWCTPCLAEMPTLDALGREGAYTVIAIATDKDTTVVKDFLKQQTWGPGVQVWFDRLGGTTRESIGAIGLPVTYVLDPSLTVRLATAGEHDWSSAKMRKRIEKALQ